MPRERRHLPNRRRPTLILSSNPDTSDLYVLSFRSERHAVVSASSLDGALRLIADRSVSAVVVDVAHPGVDWDACRQMIAAVDSDVPVIVLTGWVEQEARDKAFSLGCAAFVAKPASPDRLREVLQRTRDGERGIVLVD